MSSLDLERFLFKVEQLNQLVRSLEVEPGRRSLLEACINHDEVVTLAKSWGYEIGRRWGEDIPLK